MLFQFIGHIKKGFHAQLYFDPFCICILISNMTEVTIDDLIKALPLVEKIPVVALKGLLEQRVAIDDQQEKQVQSIRKKYQNLLKPLLSRASELIMGSAPTEKETADLSQYLKAGETVKPVLKGKQIDNYWNSVIENSPLASDVQENEEKALENLKDIQILFPKENEDNNGLSLCFLFKPNEYFHQTKITRHLRTEKGQPICLEGEQITWKNNNWLTHEKKKVTNKATGETKITQGKKIKSFFDIFLDWTVEDVANLDRVSRIMSELGELIVKDSLSYFLGLIENGDSDDEQDEYGSENDDEDDFVVNAGKK